MIHQVKLISPLATAVNDYFTAFKSDIIALSSLQWKEEDYKGESFSQWKVAQYYNFMYLLCLVYEDYNRTKDLNYAWSYYEDKYNLPFYKKCISCENIDYDKCLSIFNFPSSVNSGIELMSIENDFEINSDGVIYLSDISILDLINTSNECVNYIEQIAEQEREEYVIVTGEFFNVIQDPGPDNDNEDIIDN